MLYLFFSEHKEKREDQNKLAADFTGTNLLSRLDHFLVPPPGKFKAPCSDLWRSNKFELAFALHLQQVTYKAAGTNMMIGAILFIISDSVLAINKFYQPFKGAGIIIMLTYAFAQMLIVLGVIKYNR